MAITVVTAGFSNTGSKSSQASFAFAEGGDFQTNDIVFVVGAGDNGGASGAALSTTANFNSFADWTADTQTYEATNRTAGSAAFDGCTLFVLYARALGVTSPTPQFYSHSGAFTLATVACAGLGFALRGAGRLVNSATATGTGTSPTVTTGSTPLRATKAGDIVIGVVAVESNTAITTGDADTTNGSWSTFVNAGSAGSGGDATKMSVGYQYKVVTADGAQTFNPTVTNTDRVIGVYTFAPSSLVPPRRSSARALIQAR